MKVAIETARLAGQSCLPPALRRRRQWSHGRRKENAAEAPVMRFAKLGGTWMERGMDDELWQAVADLHREDVKLDEASVAVDADASFRRQLLAGGSAIAKSRSEDPVLRLVRAFEDSMTLDTVRNEYLLHRRIHERFADERCSARRTSIRSTNGCMPNCF